MLAHRLSPLYLKFLNPVDLPNILPHQIQVSTFSVKPQQMEQILHISITLINDKTLSLFFL